MTETAAPAAPRSLKELENIHQSNMTPTEIDLIKAYLEEKRTYQKALKEKAAGTCGDSDHPSIFLSNHWDYGVREQLTINTFPEGNEHELGTAIRVFISGSEAKDLIEKLQAFVESLNVQKQIDKFKYKVEYR